MWLLAEHFLKTAKDYIAGFALKTNRIIRVGGISSNWCFGRYLEG
jgi:hypothetical protein